MLRIAIAIGLSGLLVACGERPQSAVEGAAPAQLDYIDAVPIDKNAPIPVASAQPVAKKEEPKAEPEAEKAEAMAAPAPAPAPATAPAPAAPPRPAAPSNDAASATRRANEAVAPRSETEVPYRPN